MAWGLHLPTVAGATDTFEPAYAPSTTASHREYLHRTTAIPGAEGEFGISTDPNSQIITAQKRQVRVYGWEVMTGDDFRLLYAFVFAGSAYWKSIELVDEDGVTLSAWMMPQTLMWAYGGGTYKSGAYNTSFHNIEIPLMVLPA